MMREVRVWWLAIGVVGLMTSYAFAKATPAQNPALVNPSGLGPGYTGPVPAGLGVSRSGTAFGFKAGEFVIQPRFFLENEFSSNFFKVDSRNGVKETPAFSFHLRPGVAVNMPKASTVRFGLMTDLDVRLPASDDDAVTDQTNIGLVAETTTTFTLKGLMSFRLKDRFRRDLLVRPLSAAGGNSNRNVNQLGADITFHPGGGALEFELGYSWNLLLYDFLTGLNDSTHQFRFLSSWRFLPLNYMFLESTLGIQAYAQTPTEQELETPGNLANGKPLKVYAGFSGYLTSRIALSLRAGYGNSLLTSGEDFSSFVGDARVTFRFTARTALHVGGGRNFNLAGLGGYVDTTRAFVSFEQSFGDVVLLHADIGMSYVKYGAFAPANVVTEVDDGSGGVRRYETCTRIVFDGEPEGNVDCEVNGPEKRTTPREDVKVGAGLLADFDISRIFGMSLGYRFDASISDFGIQSRTFEINGANADPVDAQLTSYQSYMDHRVFLTLNLRY